MIATLDFSMKLDTLDISTAQKVCKPFVPDRGGIKGQHFLPEGFDELRLFALLKAKFGSPNGFLTFLGRPGGDPDGPFKWDYIFSPDGKINVQVVRTVMAVELQWWNGDVNPEELVGYLERSISMHADIIEDAIATLDHYKLILNPYIRHKTLVDLAAKELSELSLIEPQFPIDVKRSEEVLEEFKNAFASYISAVDKQASLTLLAVTESAFMAEAYLNMLLALLMRPEIRVSKSIQQETLFRKWRSKVERLPLDCLHVLSPDMGDSRIRDAKNLFDLRNKVAHSYPDKEEMKVGEMWFEQSFPVLEAGQPFRKFAIALHNQLPSVNEALFCIETAKKFVKFLTEIVDPKVRDSIEFLIESNPIGFNETKGIYGVPFGRTPIIYSGYGPKI